MFFSFLKKNVFKNKDFYDRDSIGKEELPEKILGKKVQRFVTLCVIVGVITISLETIPNFGKSYFWYFLLIEVFISMVFAVEYGYRLYKSKKKGDFFINIFNIIDLLSFVPFFIGLFFHMIGGIDIFKILRLLRVLRLFEVSSHSPIVLGFLHTIREYKKEYMAVLSIMFSILVIISSFTYYFEHLANPSFSSIPAALWWGIVTLTTVGYGDMVPITSMGKMLGVILILLGPVLVAVMGSITILVFMDVAEAQKSQNTKFCMSCKTRNPAEANFCYNCGKDHFLASNEDSKQIQKKSLLQKIFSVKT